MITLHDNYSSYRVSKTKVLSVYKSGLAFFNFIVTVFQFYYCETEKKCIVLYKTDASHSRGA